MSNKGKKLLKDYGIFIGFIVFFFSILLLLSLFSYKKWSNSLKIQVEEVLGKSAPGSYIVGDNVRINSLFSVSAACYKVLPAREENNIKTGNVYAVIMRVTTIYGPLPAVFIYDDVNGTSFKGFACLDEELEKHFEETLKNSQLQYWEKQIPKMLEKANVASKQANVER